MLPYILSAASLILSIVSALIVTIRGYTKLEGKVEALKEQMDEAITERDEVSQQLSELNVKMARIEVAIFGYDNNNGLWSDLKEMRQTLKELADELNKRGI